MQDVDGASAMHERIMELESRLERMEKERSMSGRSRSMLRRIMPAEASHHFRAASRENLLGMRALVDHWIHRIEEREAAPAAGREEIPID
jgi:hypothetical protein